MKILNKKEIIQFIKFGVVGVSSTLVSFSVYYVVLWINVDWYLAGNIAGWVISVVNAFYWNNKYVFKKDKDSIRTLLKKLGKSYLSYGSTLLLGTLLLYLEVDIFDWSAVLSPILNLLVTVPANYMLNKHWTFH